MGYQYGWTIDPVGTAGGLTIWWRPEVRIDFLSRDCNLFDTVVKFVNGNYFFRISWFYAPSYEEGTPKFWSSISNLGVGETSPWMCTGDFNTVVDNSEKAGGIPLRWNRRNYLKDFTDANSLLDLGFCGNCFTWDNRQDGDDLVQERLDRAICNLEWMERFPDCIVQHLTRVGSDHCPLFILFQPPTTKNLLFSDSMPTGQRRRGAPTLLKMLGDTESS